MLWPPPLRIRPQIVNRIATQRARVPSAVLEPLVQTHPMEEVVARATLLVGQCLVLRNDGVANRTLLLALERERDAAPEGDETVDEAAVLRFWLVFLD